MICVYLFAMVSSRHKTLIKETLHVADLGQYPESAAER